MLYTYTSQSEVDPSRLYIGSIANLKRGLVELKQGKCPHTAKYRPWRIRTYHAFHEKETAQAFKHCLKTGSGREFA